MGMLYAKKYRINDFITIRVPTVGELADGEDEYFTAVSMLISTPTDMMVQLDDAGIDFTKISEWELFLCLFGGFQSMNTGLLFESPDFGNFTAARDRQTGKTVLIDAASGHVIDEDVYHEICRFFRDMLGVKKNVKRPANDEAKAYLIERARVKQKRRMSSGTHGSQIETQITALVNSAEFPYDYESVRGLTIYQFNASLRQVIRKVRFDNLMIGYYAGTVSAKDLNPNDLTWISN